MHQSSSRRPTRWSSWTVLTLPADLVLPRNDNEAPDAPSDAWSRWAGAHRDSKDCGW